MLDRIFRWFERRTDAFSDGVAPIPPATLTGFIWHYTKPCWPWTAVPWEGAAYGDRSV